MGLLENWTNSLQEKQGSGTTSQKGFDAQIASTEKQIQDTLAEIGKVYVQQHGLDCEPEYVELVQMDSILSISYYIRELTSFLYSSLDSKTASLLQML